MSLKSRSLITYYQLGEYLPPFSFWNLALANSHGWTVSCPQILRTERAKGTCQIWFFLKNVTDMHAPGWSERQTIQLGARTHFFSGGFIMLPRTGTTKSFVIRNEEFLNIFSTHGFKTSQWGFLIVEETTPRCMAQTTSRETKAQGTQLDRLHWTERLEWHISENVILEMILHDKWKIIHYVRSTSRWGPRATRNCDIWHACMKLEGLDADAVIPICPSRSHFCLEDGLYLDQ
jgi:hypothetical protein